MLVLFQLEMGPRYEDEKNAESQAGNDCKDESHDSTLVEQLSDVWFTDSRPVHERILAEAQPGHDGVQLVLVCHDEIGAQGERKDKPASNVARLVRENHVEASPEGTSEACKRQRKPEYYTQRDEIAKCLCLQKTWKCITFHCLEDVFFGSVKDFWVISAFLLDRLHDLIEHHLRKDDLAF